MAKDKQNSIVEPTLEELAVYRGFVNDISEEQMDIYANEYFKLVAEEKTKVSFAKFLIDKIIRPIKPGDTINIQVEKEQMVLFCLIRENINGKDYLVFCEVNKKTEELIQETQYLFFVDGVDNIGTEIIDIVPAEESEKILDILEDKINVPEDKILDIKNKEQ